MNDQNNDTDVSRPCAAAPGSETEGDPPCGAHAPAPSSGSVLDDPGQITRAERRAFWARVGPPDSGGCRRWRGALNAEGRGRHTVRGETRYAYAVALAMSGTPVPRRTVVRHLCGNAWCCEPSHLSTEGGQAANNRDTVRHGRHRSAILTPDNAREIRRRLATSDPPLQKDLAREYGVSPSAISAVAREKTFVEAAGHRTAALPLKGPVNQPEGDGHGAIAGSQGSGDGSI